MGARLLSVLDGLRVVELAAWVAGPAVGGVLADWGADVVKVEPPRGDPFRQLFATLGLDPTLPNAPFALDNRGKRSVVLDLPAESEAMEELLAGADVFVTNMRPGALERLGLEPATTVERHPRLVYASVTGYGLTGPDRDRPGYDIGAFWARPGIADLMTVPGSWPPPARAGLGDHATALALVGGILAALYQRTTTGKGQVVETSLLRTGMYCVGWELGIQLAVGKVAGAADRSAAANPMVNSYRAADDRWFFLIGLESDRHFPGLTRALGRTDLADDERFRTANARLVNRRELIALLDELFAAEPFDVWAARFDAEDVWWAPVQTPAEVVADPQALAADAIVDVPAGAGAPAHRAINSPVTFHGAPHKPRPVPGLGEHAIGGPAPHPDPIGG